MTTPVVYCCIVVWSNLALIHLYCEYCSRYFLLVFLPPNIDLAMESPPNLPVVKTLLCLSLPFENYLSYFGVGLNTIKRIKEIAVRSQVYN